MVKMRLLVFVALAVPALAQTTIKEALVKHWQVSKDFTLAVAKLMPAEKYGFKPVPEEMSFSQVVIQVAGANMNACANAGGTSARPSPKRSWTRRTEKEKSTRIRLCSSWETLSISATKWLRI